MYSVEFSDDYNGSIIPWWVPRLDCTR